EILSATTLILSVTTRESPPHISAWKRIEDVARDPGNPASLDALVLLAQQQPLAPTGSTSNNRSALFKPGAQASQPSMPLSPLASETSLSLGPRTAPQSPTTIGLREIADALDKHPQARPYHHLLALQLRVQHDPALASQYVAD